MTDQQAAQRGIDAQRVLEAEVFKEAMNGLKSQIMAQWKECPVRDQEGQLLLLQMAKIADKFEGILTGMINTGRFAQNKIDLDSARNESTARRFMRRVA